MTTLQKMSAAVQQMKNSEIDRIINMRLGKELDRKIAHSRIIDGMTYAQILCKFFPQYEDSSDRVKKRVIRFKIRPIIEKAMTETPRNPEKQNEKEEKEDA